jgi:cell division protease FtsH
MVARYGMSEKLGTVSYDNDGEVFIGRDFQTTKSYSEKVAGTIDDEIKVLVDRAYDHCRRILKENEDKVQQVAQYLLDNETMTGEQFVACMEGRPIEADENKITMFRVTEAEE